jgi:azurin
MVGGGESSSTSFKPADLDAGGEYTFFCTFPGHFALMKGTVKLVD